MTINSNQIIPNYAAPIQTLNIMTKFHLVLCRCGILGLLLHLLQETYKTQNILKEFCFKQDTVAKPRGNIIFWQRHLASKREMFPCPSYLHQSQNAYISWLDAVKHVYNPGTATLAQFSLSFLPSCGKRVLSVLRNQIAYGRIYASLVQPGYPYLSCIVSPCARCASCTLWSCNMSS